MVIVEKLKQQAVFPPSSPFEVSVFDAKTETQNEAPQIKERTPKEVFSIVSEYLSSLYTSVSDEQFDIQRHYFAVQSLREVLSKVRQFTFEEATKNYEELYQHLDGIADSLLILDQFIKNYPHDIEHITSKSILAPHEEVLSKELARELITKPEVLSLLSAKCIAKLIKVSDQMGEFTLPDDNSDDYEKKHPVDKIAEAKKKSGKMGATILETLPELIEHRKNALRTILETKGAELRELLSTPPIEPDVFVSIVGVRNLYIIGPLYAALQEVVISQHYPGKRNSFFSDELLAALQEDPSTIDDQVLIELYTNPFVEPMSDLISTRPDLFVHLPPEYRSIFFQAIKPEFLYGFRLDAKILERIGNNFTREEDKQASDWREGIKLRYLDENNAFNLNAAKKELIETFKNQTVIQNQACLVRLLLYWSDVENPTYPYSEEKKSRVKQLVLCALEVMPEARQTQILMAERAQLKIELENQPVANETGAITLDALLADPRKLLEISSISDALEQFEAMLNKLNPEEITAQLNPAQLLGDDYESAYKATDLYTNELKDNGVIAKLPNKKLSGQVVLISWFLKTMFNNDKHSEKLIRYLIEHRDETETGEAEIIGAVAPEPEPEVAGATGD